jgi:hypothetical protein
MFCDDGKKWFITCPEKAKMVPPTQQQSQWEGKQRAA